MKQNKAQKEFRNIYAHERNGQKIFCYRTGMTVYEDVYANGRYMSAGWNASGYTLNVLDDMPTRLNNALFTEAQAFDVEADGTSLSWDWDYVGFECAEETLENGTAVTHGTVTLKSRIKPLVARLHTVLDGTSVFSRYFEVENVGDAPIAINAVAPMCGGIEVMSHWQAYMNGTPDPTKIYSLGYMSQAAHNHEGFFKWHDLPNMTYSIDGKYKFNRYRHPIFLLRNNLLGTVMIAQMGWTGGYRFDFTLDTDNTSAETSILSFRMEMAGQKPFLILASGERFESPRVHIGMVHGDLDDAVNAMHKHVRKAVFTLPPARGVKGWIEGGMGPERLMDVRATKHFADTMAEVGAETLIIDAGWYCPPGTAVREWHPRTGDWYPHPDRYPNGIEEIRDYIHSKGLLFGLGLDLERLGKSSQAAKDHPEWLSKCYVNGAENSQLNMALPEAAAWAEAELSRVIEEYKIDIFRLDYNLGNLQLQNRFYGENGLENAYVRYCKNVNDMYERLRRKYPDVIFENCAGGGGRTDLAFVANFTHTWVSDCNFAPRSFAITNGMTMALPPEVVDRLASGMGCHSVGSLAFHSRNTIFGRPTTNDYNAVGSEMNPMQIEIVRHTLDIYKKHIRPYIDESVIFHHTPELVNDPTAKGTITDQPRGTGVLERASEDCRHGVVGIFNLADTGATVTTVYPKGVDPALTYNVTLDNCGSTIRMSGAELQNVGIRVSLPAPITSELVIYEAV